MRRSDLEQKVRELTEFFDSMPAMVWFKDTHNRLLRINLRAAQSAGKSPQEMEGRAMEELYPLQAAGYLADDQEVVQSRSPKLGIIETISDGDGQIHWIQTDKVPIFGPEGEVKGVLVLAQDISRRKLAEESLRLLSSAVEQSKEAILITDADLVPPGPHIVFVNPAFTRMSGYSAEEVMGQSPRILQGPRTDQAALEKMKDTLRQGIPFEGESVNYRKDGQEFLSEWQVTPLRDEAGTVTHIVALHRDITVRRRMESQLFQAHKLETVGKLAGGVAQEFNTILTSILGQAQLLLHDLSPGSALRIHVLDIQQAAERAARLTSQLLAYGRKQFLSIRVLDLGRLLTDLEDTLRQLMGPSIQVRLRLSPGLRKVRADPAQLEQMIVNLAMNAAEAMPEGGVLTLETANVTLEPESVQLVPDLVAGEFVLLTVSDTGMGLSEEVQARAFEPFYTTKAGGGGIGLGLSTCYGIAKQSGGHMAVSSEVGRGATFKVYFPQFCGPPAADGSPRSELKGGSETILLVEGEPALREMAQKLLARLGYRVLTAADGLEAWEIFQQRETGALDLLFTDLLMPQMNGQELAGRILLRSPETKILFTSAYARSAVIHRGTISAGAELLQRPYTPSDLAHKLREMLDHPPGIC